MKLALLLLGISAAAKPAVTYRYHHLETTGLTDELRLADGSKQTIQFARESDAKALKSLHVLMACDAYATVEPGLTLTGELKSKVQHTPSAPDRAESEPYREFVLRSWTVEPPEMARGACPKAFAP